MTELPDTIKPSPFKGKLHSQETKDKISKAKLGKPGKLHSQETKDKISKAKLGKPRSQETKDKISKAKLGKPRSQETKEKMSKAKKSSSFTVTVKLPIPHVTSKHYNLTSVDADKLIEAERKKYPNCICTKQKEV